MATQTYPFSTCPSEFLERSKCLGYVWNGNVLFGLCMFCHEPILTRFCLILNDWVKEPGYLLKHYDVAFKGFSRPLTTASKQRPNSVLHGERINRYLLVRVYTQNKRKSNISGTLSTTLMHAVDPILQNFFFLLSL